MGRRSKPQPPQEEGAPAWMNTYGDMVTLLLTFFVLLFSFSSMDAEKWKQIVQAFTGKVDVESSTTSPDPNFTFDDVIFPDATPGPTGSPGPEMGEGDDELLFDELYERIKNHVQENEQESTLNVAKDNGLIIIRITDTALFDSGHADIRPDALPLLDTIISIFDEYDDAIRQIQIEGHTDNVPISSARFKSNWDLSTSRAVSVVQYCILNSKLSPMKYSASGYGEYHPIADNDTEAGKAKNRRVDFLLMSTKSFGVPGVNMAG